MVTVSELEQRQQQAGWMERVGFVGFLEHLEWEVLLGLQR